MVKLKMIIVYKNLYLFIYLFYKINMYLSASFFYDKTVQNSIQITYYIYVVVFSIKQSKTYVKFNYYYFILFFFFLKNNHFSI